MGFECVMCMETLETPAPADVVDAPETEQDFNQPGPSRRTNPENTEEYRSKICATTCGHIFHRACLNRWFFQKPQRQCPSCRKSLTQENIIHIYPPSVSADFLYQKMLRFTEIESSLHQCDCGSVQCSQVYAIHKTIVSDHSKILELVQKFTDQCDDRIMLEARVASLVEENAQLKRRETPSTSSVTGEQSSNSTQNNDSHGRRRAPTPHPSSLRDSVLGYPSLIMNLNPASALDDDDNDEFLASQIRAQMEGLENVYRRFAPALFREIDVSVDPDDFVDDGLGIPNASRDLALHSSRHSRPTSGNNLVSSAASNAEEAADASNDLQESQMMDDDLNESTNNAELSNAAPDYSEVDLVGNSYSVPVNWTAFPSSSTQSTSDIARYLEVSAATNSHAAENRQAPRVATRRSARQTAARRNMESPPVAHSYRRGAISSSRYSGSRAPRSANCFLRSTNARTSARSAAASNRNRPGATTEGLNEATVVLRRLSRTPQESPEITYETQPPILTPEVISTDSELEEIIPARPDTPLSTSSSHFNNVSEDSTISTVSSPSTDRAATLAASPDDEPRTLTDNNSQRPSTSSSRAANPLEGSSSSSAIRRTWHCAFPSTARPPPPRSWRFPTGNSIRLATSLNSENLQGDDNSNPPHGSSKITEITLDDETSTDDVATTEAGPSPLASTSESAAPGEKITPAASSGTKPVKIYSSFDSAAKKSNNNNRRKTKTITIHGSESEDENERIGEELKQRLSMSDSDSD